MNNVSPTLWPNRVRHVQKIEEEYRGNLPRISAHVEPFVINLQDDSDSEDMSDTNDTIFMLNDL